MRKPWQELGSPAKCLGGVNRGSATEVGLLPLPGEREGGEAPGSRSNSRSGYAQEQMRLYTVYQQNNVSQQRKPGCNVRKETKHKLLSSSVARVLL